MLPKRITGFMDLAQQIVDQTPGLTAQEIYRRACEIAKPQNRKLSAAKSPQGSLVATLHKHYSHYGLTRKRVGREFQYFPVTSGNSPPKTPATVAPDHCCLTLPNELNNRLDALVSLGRFQNKCEAQRELVAIGLEVLLAKLAS